MAEVTDIDQPQVDTPEAAPDTGGPGPVDRGKELHDIVSKMIVDKQPEDNIKKVVEYYGKQYGIGKQGTQSPAQPAGPDWNKMPQVPVQDKKQTDAFNAQQQQANQQVPVAKQAFEGQQQTLTGLKDKAIKDIESDAWREHIFKGERPALTQYPNMPVQSFQKIDPKAVDSYLDTLPKVTDDQKYWLRNQILNYGTQRQADFDIKMRADRLKNDHPDISDKDADEMAAVENQKHMQNNIANKLNNVGLSDKPLDVNSPFHDQITGLNKALMGAINYSGDLGGQVGSLLKLGNIPGLSSLGAKLQRDADDLKGRNVIPQNGEAGNFLAGEVLPTALDMESLRRVAMTAGAPLYKALGAAKDAGKFGQFAEGVLGGVAVSPLNSYIIAKQYYNDQIKQGVSPVIAGSKSDQLLTKNLMTDLVMTPLQMGLMKLPTGSLAGKLTAMGAEGLASSTQFLMQGYNQEKIDNPALHLLDYAKNNKGTLIEGAVLGMLQKAAVDKMTDWDTKTNTNKLFRFDRQSGSDDLPNNRAIASNVLSALELKDTPKRVEELHDLTKAMGESGTYTPTEEQKIHGIIDDVAAVKGQVPKFGTSEQKLAVFNELLNARAAERFIAQSGNEAAAEPAKAAKKESEARIGKIMSGDEPLYFVNGNETHKEQLEQMIQTHPDILSENGVNIKIIGDPEMQEEVKKMKSPAVTEVRHGENDQDAEGLASSQNNVKLNADGIEGAKKLGDELAGVQSKNVPQKQANTVDLKEKIIDEYKSTLSEMRKEPSEEGRSKVMRSLPQRLYERMAKDASDESGAKNEGQLQELRASIQKAWEDNSDAVRELQSGKSGDASSRLLKAITDSVVVPDLSHGTSSKPHTGITKVVSSDIPRAEHTADIVADRLNVPRITSEGLRAWDIGDFDNKPEKEWDEAKEYFVNHPAQTEYKGQHIGESFDTFKDRVVKAKQDVVDAAGDSHTLLVNHSNNIMLDNAIEKHGGWNEEAKKEYLSSKPPEPTALQENTAPPLRETKIEGRSPEFQEFYNKFKDEIALINTSSNTFRVDIPEMTQKEREQAVRNIDDGKDTKAEKKLLDALEVMHKKGYIEYTTGSGLGVDKQRVPIEEWDKAAEEVAHEFISGWKPIEDLAGLFEKEIAKNPWGLADESSNTHDDELKKEKPTGAGDFETNNVIGTDKGASAPLLKEEKKSKDESTSKVQPVRSSEPSDSESAKKSDEPTKEPGNKQRVQRAGEGKTAETDKPEPGREDRSAAADKSRSGQGNIASGEDFEKELKKELEQAKIQYARKNSFREYTKKYPDDTIDEFNVARSKQPLAKVGESTGATVDREKYADTSHAISDIREHFKGDPLIQRVTDFLEPILKENPQIKIDPKAELDPGYLGLNYPDGKIAINFDRIGDKDTLMRTMLHEYLHGVTREEINGNQAFRDELTDLLGPIREKLKVPESESLISVLVDRGLIDKDLYGATNEHELLAEVFTNQKFHDLLSDIKYKGDSLLKTLFQRIASFFSEKYKSLVDAKKGITADNYAEYLQQLTEKTIQAKQMPVSEGGEELAAKAAHPTDTAVKNVIKRADDLSDDDIRERVKKLTGYDDARINNLITDARKEQGTQMKAEQLVEQALEYGKQAIKDAKEQKKLQIGAPKENVTALDKLKQTAKRWYMDAKDDVSDVKSIIRQEKGKEEFEIDKQFHATESLVNYWNKVPAKKQMAFILSLENPAMLKNQSDEVREMGKLYRDRMDATFERINNIMPNLNYIQDYFPHFWDKPDLVKNYMANAMGKNPMEGSKSFAKKRFFDTILDGLSKGYKLTTTNPEELVRIAEMNAWKFEAAHNIFERMKSQGLLAYSTGANVPDSWKPVTDPLFNRIGAYIDKEGEANITKGSYVMPPDVAKLMNDYLSPGIKGPVADAVRKYNNMKNLFQLGFGAYHVGTTSLEATITGVTNGIQKISTGNPKNILSGIADLAKSGTFLPNIIEQVYRGRKAINAYKAGDITGDVNNLIDANARIARQKMYSLETTYNMRKAYGRLVADKDFSQIPKVAWHALLSLPEAINKPLMNWWVPALKVGGYLKSLDAETMARPNMKPSEFQRAKERIWDSMDNRLGQVVYDNLFVNKTAKDLLFMSLRSFGWTGGTVQAAGKGVGEIPLSAQRLVKGEGMTQRTAYLAALPTTIGFFGAMYQYLNTGQGPQEMKDYFFPKDGTKNPDGTDHRVDLPSYMKDVLAYKTHPVQTAIHKTSPALNDIAEVYQNKDFYGEQVYNPKDPLFQKGIDIVKHEFESMAPFSFKNRPGEEKSMSEQLGTKTGIEQKFGIMPAPKDEERSEVQSKIMRAYGEQVDSGNAATHAELEQRVARRHLREYLYNGGDWNDADEEMKRKANVKESAQSQFVRDSKIDSYERYFKQLKGETRIELFKEMTPEDKDKYRQYLPKNYIEDDKPEEAPQPTEKTFQ